jgi:subtilase family serine protease
MVFPDHITKEEQLVNGTIKLVVPLVAALAIAACNGGSSNIPGAAGPSTSQSQSHTLPLGRGVGSPACPQVTGVPTCLALVQSKSGISPAVAGWAPIDFQTRYNLPSSTKGSGQIVAIVDAYDNPNVTSDLGVYRTNFGLGAANFTKYNQLGQTHSYPSGSVGWGVEIDLDVDMVSAVCPNCTIYLIEANSSSSADLDTAEAEAVTLGAHIVSNSWICYGSNSCVDATKFATPGVLYLAASGDAGYDNNGNPESLANVVSVGGTTLSKSGSKYSESAWSGAGGGCSNNGSGTGVTKPSWQHDPDCAYRTDTDVSAVAQGVAEYDSYGYGGWFTVGGTSIASPLIGGVYGLAENATKQDAGQKIWTLTKKQLKKDLHYIGSGGGSCGYLCGDGKYKKYYSGPTGWGTPNGIGAF